jgi:hypothetical protein
MRKLIFISIISLLGCQHADDAFKSYGNETTVIRLVGSFNQIVAGEKFDIILVQDSAKEGLVEMTAGENVIEGYSTEVKNNELQIRNVNKFNWVRKLNIRQTVVVYFKNIDKLQINGSAKFTCRDSIIHHGTLEINHGGLEDATLKINGDYIFVNCSNTGGVVLSGKCFLYSGAVDDISFVDNRNLKVKKSYLTSYSRDDSYVDGSEVLEIRLFGVGNVYYTVTPSSQLKTEDSGEGNIIKY